MGPHFQPRQKTEQDDDRQCRYECGKPPMTRRVINLGPSHGKTFRLRWLRYLLAAFLSRNKSCCKACQLFRDFHSEPYGQRKVVRQRPATQESKRGRSEVRRFAFALEKLCE